MNVNDRCKYSNDQITCMTNWCCVKGVCIAPLASLTNNSCNPNARRCFTDDSELVLYALQPIKKNSQVYTYDAFIIISTYAVHPCQL